MAKNTVEQNTENTSPDVLLKKIAKKLGVDSALLKKLIEIEEGKVHLERRRGIVYSLRKTIEDFEGGRSA